MKWIGKILGCAFGFLTGGPLGAIFGAAVGHQFDTGRERLGYSGPFFRKGAQHRVQMAFFTATFSVMGHIAKADGQITQAEINLANAIMDKMDLPEDMRKTARSLFNEGKKADFPLDKALEQLRAECHRSSSLLRMFLEIQLQAGYADGQLHPEEERLLLHISDRLQFSRFEYQRLRTILEAQARFSGSWSGAAGNRYSRPSIRKPSIADAYGVLGLKQNADNAEVKRAYRRLMSQHHPDKLVAKGLPEEMMKIATEKTQQIQKAYDLIRNERKM
ncbi:MAG: co-chaperone DjlA [Methylococcales bacterium]